MVARLRSFAVSRELVWVLVVVGAGLRLRQYLTDRSLWLDESFIAVNLIEHPLGKLFGPLQFNQEAPAGFLVVEKLAIDMLGKGEYVLRAFPLLCGIGSLVLFAVFARRLLAPAVVPIVVALFAFSNQLVYYSSEVKPYAADVVAALVLYLFAFSWASGNRSYRLALMAGVGGAVLIQLSYVGIFVAAGIGATLFGERAWHRAWHDVRSLALAVAPWALSAGLVLWLYARNLTRYTFEGDVFVRLPTSPKNVAWWATPLKDLSSVVVGIYHPYAAPIIFVEGVLCVVGAVAVFNRHRFTFLIMTVPVLLMIVASALHKYPVLARTLLFLSPLVLILLGYGIATVASLGRSVGARRGLVIAVLGISLAAYPAIAVARNFITPKTNENMKWALRYIADRWKPGDLLYLHYPTQFAFTYYRECDCFHIPTDPAGGELWPVRRAPEARPSVQMPRALIPENSNVLVGVFAGKYYRGIYRADVQSIVRHPRVWLLFTFVVTDKEWRFIQGDLLAPLDRRGRKVLSVKRPDTRVLLYEFSG